MKCLLIALMLLFSIDGFAQDNFAGFADGYYFNALRPIDNAILSRNFSLFRKLFQQLYLDNSANVDTLSKTKKMQYLNDVYFYAAIFSFSNKKIPLFIKLIRRWPIKASIIMTACWAILALST